MSVMRLIEQPSQWRRSKLLQFSFAEFHWRSALVFCSLQFSQFLLLFRVLKLSEVENNSSQHQVSEDFVIWANREDRVSQKYFMSFL